MNDIRFRYTGIIKRDEIDRTNKPHTCLYCGKQLRQKYETEYDGKTGASVRHEATGNYGAYEDNAFCGLRCGYAFGVIMAKLGKRLDPRKGPVSS